MSKCRWTFKTQLQEMGQRPWRGPRMTLLTSWVVFSKILLVHMAQRIHIQFACMSACREELTCVHFPNKKRDHCWGRYGAWGLNHASSYECDERTTQCLYTEKNKGMLYTDCTCILCNLWTGPWIWENTVDDWKRDGLSFPVMDGTLWRSYWAQPFKKHWMKELDEHI